VKCDAYSNGSLSVTIFVRMGNFPLNASLLLINMYLKTVIFINMCEFTHWCLEIMFRFLKNYFFVSKKSVLMKYQSVVSRDMP